MFCFRFRCFRNLFASRIETTARHDIVTAILILSLFSIFNPCQLRRASKVDDNGGLLVRKNGRTFRGLTVVQYFNIGSTERVNGLTFWIYQIISDPVENRSGPHKNIGLQSWPISNLKSGLYEQNNEFSTMYYGYQIRIFLQ